MNLTKKAEVLREKLLDFRRDDIDIITEFLADFAEEVLDDVLAGTPAPYKAEDPDLALDKLRGNIREIMTAKGLTKAELGKRMGMSQKTVGNHLHGNNGTRMSLPTIIKFERALKTKLIKLIPPQGE